MLVEYDRASETYTLRDLKSGKVLHWRLYESTAMRFLDAPVPNAHAILMVAKRSAQRTE